MQVAEAGGSPTNHDAKPFYLVNKLSEQFGFSRAHWYNERKRGKIAFRRAGGRTIVLHADLMAYLNSLPVAE